MVGGHGFRADNREMLGSYFQRWLAGQALWMRLTANCAVALLCLWLAFVSGNWVFFVGAFVMPWLSFNRQDVRRAREWLNG